MLPPSGAAATEAEHPGGLVLWILLAALAGVVVALQQRFSGDAGPAGAAPPHAAPAGASNTLLLRVLRFADAQLSTGMLRHVQSMARPRVRLEYPSTHVTCTPRRPLSRW